MSPGLLGCEWHYACSAKRGMVFKLRFVSSNYVRSYIAASLIYLSYQVCAVNFII